MKMAIIKSEKYNYIKISVIVAFNLFAFIYILDSIQININNKVRALSDDDIRTKGANEVCMEIDDNTKFDLFGLKDENVPLGDNIEFKFCKNVEKASSSCIYTKDSKIIKLAETIEGKKKNKNKIEVYNSENESKRKVIMYLAAGDQCLKDNNKNYKIDVELLCNKTETFEIIDGGNFNPEEDCYFKLVANTKFACGDDDAYIKLDAFGRIIVGIGAVIVGVMTGIFGYNQVNIGIFLVCTLGSLLLAALIIIIFDVSNLIVSIIIAVIFFIGGLLLFFFFIKKKQYLKFYMFLIGGLCGYPIGNIIYNLFFAIIDSSKQKLIHIIIVVLCIIIGVILGIFLPKETCIVGTSIMGAFFLMRGIAFFLYGKVDYIDEHKLYDLANSGNYEKISEMIWGPFLMYPAILIVFIVVFIIVQVKINPKWKDIDDYKLLDKDYYEKPSDLPDFKLSEYGETAEPENK